MRWLQSCGRGLGAAAAKRLCTSAAAGEWATANAAMAAPIASIVTSNVAATRSTNAMLACAMAGVLGALGCSAAQEVHEADGAVLVAQVAGEPLYQAEVQAVFDRKRCSLGPLPLDEPALDALWQSSLDDAVRARVLVRAAKAHHVAVLDEEVASVRRRLQPQPAPAAEAGLRAGAKEADDRAGQATPDQAIDPEADACVTPKPTGAAPPVPAASEAGCQLDRADLQRAAYQQLIIGKWLAQEVTARLSVTDADVAAYAAATPEALDAPARVRLGYVVLASVPDGSPDERRRNAKKLQEALDAGQLRRLVGTQAAGPAAAVYETGWLEVASLPQVVREAVASLPLRKLSAQVPLARGAAVFWLIERVAPRRQSLSDAGPRLSRKLRAERAAAAEAQAVGQLLAAANVTWVQAARPKAAGALPKQGTIR